MKQITQIMLTQIRVSDAVARYGGDEFVIFCFDLNRDGAECLVERLTEALKDALLSMSFGVASFPIDGDDSKALINTADQRLYRSKAEKSRGSHSYQHNVVCQCDDCRSGKEDGQVKSLAADL